VSHSQGDARTTETLDAIESARLTNGNVGARHRITLSSDWDVSSLNPFVGMQNALTRTAQELPNAATVLKAYTIW
jgi:predicted amidohydrolase YtcJ